MKPVDFDNTRRHLQIMLRGQELSMDQAAELATIIAERRRPEPQWYTNRRPKEPSTHLGFIPQYPPENIQLLASHIETTGIESLQKQANRIEADRTESLMFPGEPMTLTEARILQDPRPATTHWAERFEPPEKMKRFIAEALEKDRQKAGRIENLREGNGVGVIFPDGGAQ